MFPSEVIATSSGLRTLCEMLLLIFVYRYDTMTDLEGAQ